MLHLFVGLLQLVALIFIFTFHNYIRALVAVALGDETPKRLGFLTLNPLPHIDPIGTVIIPAVLILLKVPFIIGWPRTVPIDYSAFPNPRRAGIILSLVGILAFFFIALLSFALYKLLVLLHVPENIYAPLATLFQYVTLISTFFGFLNLLPIPPFDLGNLIFLLMGKTEEEIARFSLFGGIIVFILFMSGAFDYLFDPIYNFILKLF